MEIESGSEDMNEESLPSLEDEQNESLLCGACIDEASAGDEQTPGVGDRLQCGDNEEAAVSASQPHAQQHAPSGERMDSEETPLPEEEELAHVLPGRTHAEALLDSEVADRALDDISAAVGGLTCDGASAAVPSDAVSSYHLYLQRP